MVDYAFSMVIVVGIIEVEEITPFHGTQTLFEVYEVEEGFVMKLRWQWYSALHS